MADLVASNLPVHPIGAVSGFEGSPRVPGLAFGLALAVTAGSFCPRTRTGEPASQTVLN